MFFGRARVRYVGHSLAYGMSGSQRTASRGGSSGHPRPPSPRTSACPLRAAPPTHAGQAGGSAWRSSCPRTPSGSQRVARTGRNERRRGHPCSSGRPSCQVWISCWILCEYSPCPQERCRSWTFPVHRRLSLVRQFGLLVKGLPAKRLLHDKLLSGEFSTHLLLDLPCAPSPTSGRGRWSVSSCPCPSYPCLSCACLSCRCPSSPPSLQPAI